jgi:molybdate transport system substrate-binding protein
MRGWMLGTGVLLSMLMSFAVAAEVKIISGPATDGVLTQVGSQFEQQTGNTLAKKGGVTGVLKQLIESGEPFDLAIIPGPLMDNFVKQGKIAEATSKPFVRVGMGIAVRSDAPKPDISSVSKFKQAVLDAKSVTFVPEGETAVQLASVLDRLGIAEQVKAKTQVRPTVAAAIQAVASGEVELYFSLTNIIASGKGIELVGPFPPELQHYLVINTGISAVAEERAPAEALVKLLMSASADPVIKAKGLERATQ